MPAHWGDNLCACVARGQGKATEEAVSDLQDHLDPDYEVTLVT